MLYSWSRRECELVDELIAGFLSAIDGFARETTPGEVRGIDTGSRRFQYSVGDDDVMFVLDVPREANERLVDLLLARVESEFRASFAGELERFRGNVAPFSKFDPAAHLLLERAEVVVRCATCGKLVAGDYVREVFPVDAYFCCTSCRKLYSVERHLEKVTASATLACLSCGATLPVPTHCNRPMHLEEVEGEPTLVCWMGPECGRHPVPTHCGASMRFVSGQP